LSGALLAAYDELAGTYASTGPDVLILLKEDWRIDYIFPGQNKNLAGNHDTVTWDNQHNLLVFAGPGVKQGVVTDAPARLIDVAQTLLTLAGVSPAGPGDGARQAPPGRAQGAVAGRPRGRVTAPEPLRRRRRRVPRRPRSPNSFRLLGSFVDRRVVAVDCGQVSRSE
jgi:hypothetical protein